KRMRSLVIALVALTACPPPMGSGTDSGTPVTPGDHCALHACPKSCSSQADCAAGKECNGGLCANPSATLAQFSLCALDADCAPGDHCADGVCGHDCVSDRDCSAGTVCDVRGYCAAEENAGKPPGAQSPSAAPAVLSIDAPALAITHVSEPVTFSLK